LAEFGPGEALGGVLAPEELEEGLFVGVIRHPAQAVELRLFLIDHLLEPRPRPVLDAEIDTDLTHLLLHEFAHLAGGGVGAGDEELDGGYGAAVNPFGFLQTLTSQIKVELGVGVPHRGIVGREAGRDGAFGGLAATV
jgi:hypothetical protein